MGTLSPRAQSSFRIYSELLTSSYRDSSLTIFCSAMSRDSSLYPEPEKFKPERFLNEDGTVNRKHELATFGYGHR